MSECHEMEGLWDGEPELVGLWAERICGVSQSSRRDSDSALSGARKVTERKK